MLVESLTENSKTSIKFTPLHISWYLIVIYIISDEQHSVPIQMMGNYQEYLKKQASPLRELENTPSRVHMFGNPFKVNKVSFKVNKVSFILYFVGYKTDFFSIPKQS